LELSGALLLCAGFSFAVAGIGIASSERFVERDRERLAQELDGMKTKLVAAKVADDQIVGLLRVYRSAVVQQLAQQHLLIVGALILFSLLAASFGFSIMLWSKLRALSRRERTTVREPSAA